MPQNSYPYASVTVRARENRMLNREKANRMMSARDAAEAFRMLADFGYTGTDELDPMDFEKLLAAELREVHKFITDVTPNQQITDLFFSMYDYHNAKVWMKANLTGSVPPEEAVIEMGTIPSAKLFAALEEHRWGSLPKEMEAALTDIDKRFAVKQDVSLIGILLDEAYARQVEESLKTVKDKAAREYYEALFDFTNVTLLIRMKRAGTPKLIFERAMLPSGQIDGFTLKKAFDMQLSDVADAFSRTRYEQQFSAAFAYMEQTGRLTMFQKVKEDYLMKVAVENRSDIFSIGPVFAYIVSKLRETQVVRMIMTAKLNEMDMDAIADILPELPA